MEEFGLENVDSVLGLSEFSLNFGEISVLHFGFVEEFLNLLFSFWEFDLTLLVEFLDHFLIFMKFFNHCVFSNLQISNGNLIFLLYLDKLHLNFLFVFEVVVFQVLYHRTFLPEFVWVLLSNTLDILMILFLQLQDQFFIFQFLSQGILLEVHHFLPF